MRVLGLGKGTRLSGGVATSSLAVRADEASLEGGLGVRVLSLDAGKAGVSLIILARRLAACTF